MSPLGWQRGSLHCTRPPPCWIGPQSYLSSLGPGANCLSEPLWTWGLSLTPARCHHSANMPHEAAIKTEAHLHAKLQVTSSSGASQHPVFLFYISPPPIFPRLSPVPLLVYLLAFYCNGYLHGNCFLLFLSHSKPSSSGCDIIVSMVTR